VIEELELLQAPAEWRALRATGLAGTTCVVFDVLRATSSMLTALAHGALEVVPVAEIDEALAWRARDPSVLLAGERDGLRITGAQTGGVEFDLGNSPRELTPARVSGRRIVMTTTNGTRALRACRGADAVLPGAFLNLRALHDWLRAHPPRRLLLVAAGTFEQAALEDALAAGALCARLAPLLAGASVGDGARMARELHRVHAHDVAAALALGVNGSRLLAVPELRDDVACCARVDALDLVAALDREGRVRRLPDAADAPAPGR
jgi:2-phosphosulfolactate phosphatase